MEKIATHNSATGEKSGGWTWLLLPFAKCQSKSIREQYLSGCRLFDIRLKWVNGGLRCGHGLWYTKKFAYEILEEINTFSEEYNSSVPNVILTFEDKKINKQASFMAVDLFKRSFKNINWGPVYIKWGENSGTVSTVYDLMWDREPQYNVGATEQSYKVLDGKSWHTFLPIPWLWKKLYYNKPEFNDNIYKFVDFL